LRKALQYQSFGIPFIYEYNIIFLMTNPKC